jgi:hypothetical protein
MLIRTSLMPKGPLLKSQANEVLLTISKAGFDPIEFQWEEHKSQYSGNTAALLVHESSGSYFTFDYVNRDGHKCEYSPGEESPEVSAFSGSWGGQLLNVRMWLRFVKKEVDSPDLWSALEDRTLLERSISAEDFENTPFIEAEKAEVVEKVRELGRYIVEAHQLPESSIEQLHARLEYLIGATERMGRKDWVMLLVSTLFGVVTSLPFDAVSARDVFSIAGSLFRFLLDHPDLLM